MMTRSSPSLYFVTKDILIFEKAVRGYKSDIEKIFRWNNVTLNLPSFGSYDLSFP